MKLIELRIEIFGTCIIWLGQKYCRNSPDLIIYCLFEYVKVTSRERQGLELKRMKFKYKHCNNSIVQTSNVIHVSERAVNFGLHVYENGILKK